MVATRAFTASQVATVARGMILPNAVAKQARLIILLGAIDGRRLTPAGKFGAGWRDMATQVLFSNAARGEVSAIRKLRAYGTVLASSSTISVARPGTSSHGDGTRADWLFNGLDASADDAAFMRAHRWVQEFGSSDRNHFRWAGNMAGAVATTDRNRIVAAWLNAQHLGKHTTTDHDGVWPAKSNLSWLLQTQGHEDGLYPASKYRIDGEAGDRTRWLRDHYAAKLLTV